MSSNLLENKISKETLESLIKMYQDNTSIREISRKTGFNRGTLSRMFERLNVKTTKGNHYRTYFFDFNYFEKIDSSNKAYWLGFLYADGCILPVNRYGEQTFKLQLGEKDIDALEKFKEDIQSTYPIRRDDSHRIKNPNYQAMVLLEQRSQKTVDDLKKLGCVESKSLVLEFPTKEQVPEKYIYDFIRGYFDGDGSISFFKKQNVFQISFVGTEKFIRKLSTFFEGGSIIKDKRRKNSWYFNLGGNLQVLQAYHLMYDNAERYLQRKYDVFQILLNKYNES